MSEILNESSPQKRVFGEVFSIDSCAPVSSDHYKFFEDRLKSVREKEDVWLPRTLDSERGVVADLFSNGHIVATLVFDYDTDSASVYTSSAAGKFGDKSIFDNGNFNDAVIEAENYLANS